MKKSRFDVWRWSVLLPALLLAVPVLVIFSSVFNPQPEVWRHLRQTVLADYVVNSLLLAGGTGLGAMTTGTLCAWLVSRYQFAGRRVVEWLLLLPLAMPAYIIAYTYTGMLDFAGPLQSALRAQFDWRYGDYWFPQIRSLGGAIVMLSLVLYPYVYMLARTAFREQPASLLEASRTLGLTPWQHLRKVALPLARPAILTGTALAMMEAFADYGTVQFWRYHFYYRYFPYLVWYGQSGCGCPVGGNVIWFCVAAAIARALVASPYPLLPSGAAQPWYAAG